MYLSLSLETGFDCKFINCYGHDKDGSIPNNMQASPTSNLYYIPSLKTELNKLLLNRKG